MDMIAEATHVARHEAARHDGQASAARAHAGEYLTFRLGAEEYGIDILRVQEIRSHEPPTRIANAPAFLKGVVNLRGVIVPIVDLRIKLGCASAELNAFTVVIVLNVRGRVVGAVVDSVSDVLELSGAQIKPAPELAAGIDARYITGIATVAADAGGKADANADRRAGEQRMLILVDIETLMASADMGLFDSAR
jgi:purine-binding chemotaxis protein CheW